MSKKILTIDDSKTLRMIVGKHLRPFQVEILEAENGLIGVEVARREKPDLILLDYNMPVLDGYHTLTELKTDPDLKPIPVIMLTTETVKDTVMKLIKLGLRDYVAKPFTRDTLLLKVNPVLNLFVGDTPPSEAEVASWTAGVQAAEAAGKIRVLVVDDKENVLKILKEYLGEAYDVVTAETGQAAINKLPSGQFEWLFLDLDLPDMHSYQIFDAYREAMKHSSKKKRVIGMSLRTAQKEIQDARAKGIMEFLLKPFTKEDVQKIIEKGSQGTGQQAKPEKPAGLLQAHGNVRVLSCPDATDPAYAEFGNVLGHELMREVGNMADEGLNRLVIRLTPGIISSFPLAKRFIGALNQIQGLGINVRLVADTEKMKEWLNHYSETKELAVSESIESAVKSFDEVMANAS